MTPINTSDSEVKRVTNKQVIKTMFGYVKADVLYIHERMDTLVCDLDKFKEVVGDFGEKIPRARERLEEAIGKVEDAIAEIELVRDEVT